MILVTGGGGLIGAALTHALASGGACVASTSRSGGDGCQRLDLGDVQAADLPPGVETAVLCAWHGGVNECAADPVGTAALNVGGNIALIRRLRAAGARIMFLSTSLVFSAPPTAPRSRATPCCEYARQKVAVEAELNPDVDAVVRVTKVAETLLPRLRDWAGALKSGRTVRAANDLRVAPVTLAATILGLCSLASRFQPGIFQMSARCDASYHDLAMSLVRRLGVASDLLLNSPLAGTLFDPVPTTGLLDISGPPGCLEWPDGADAMQSLVEQATS